jgi:hypothetical protein
LSARQKYPVRGRIGREISASLAAFKRRPRECEGGVRPPAWHVDCMLGFMCASRYIFEQQLVQSLFLKDDITARWEE